MANRAFEEVLAPNQYFDRYFNADAAKILPGEYFVTGRDMVLVTVLGSCVSACIRDRISGIGGMNHFMLPDRGGDQKNPLVGASMRYGSYAMEILINQLIKLGANRLNLEAKVFGGGQVLRGFTAGNVGERNAEFVLDYLSTENIRVVAKDLLDIYPRKIYFFPQSGKVLVKKLRNMNNSTIVEREQEYVARIASSDVVGDAELFS